MKFKIELNEDFVLLEQDSFGEELFSLESKLLDIIKSSDGISFIVDFGSERAEGNVVDFLKRMEDKVAYKKGIIVAIRVENSEETDFGEVLYLPTFHEAKEAIFMNDLENQFMEELGDD